jgi:bile acid:Na+ symporter, BASS family
MLRNLMKIRLHPTNFIPLLAIPAAWLLPSVGRMLSPYTTWILAGLLLSSFLGVKVKEMLSVIEHPMRSVWTVFMILFAGPILILPIANWLFPEYRVAALLFMMLPAAVSSPAVAAIYGGNVAIATVDAVLSNLLSTLSIPLLFGLFVEGSMQVEGSSILRQMVFVIVIPFLIGTALNHFAPRATKVVHRHSRMLNLILLFFLFYAAFAPYVKEMVLSLTNLHLLMALAMTHLILHLLARLASWHSKHEDQRIGILCNMVLPNVGLGVVLAQHYLGFPEMIFILLSEVVWVIVVGLIHYLK